MFKSLLSLLLFIHCASLGFAQSQSNPEKLNFLLGGGTGTLENFHSYPIISNKKIYKITNGFQRNNYSYLVAYDLNGHLVWRKEFDRFLNDLLCIDSKENVYVNTNYHLYSINNLGEINWKYGEEYKKSFRNIVISKDDIIYMIDWSPNKFDLYAINSEGSENWIFKGNGKVSQTPAISNDGNIYVASYDDETNDNYLYAINPDGSQKWKIKMDGKGSPSIGSDDTIYFGSENKHLYAINPDGSQKWKFKAIGEYYSLAAVGADGTIYIVAGDANWGIQDKTDANHILFAINPDGSEKWRRKVRNNVKPTPVDSLNIIAIGNQLISISSGEVIDKFEFEPPTLEVKYTYISSLTGNWETTTEINTLGNGASRSIIDINNGRIIFLDGLYRLHGRSSDIIKIKNSTEMKIKIDNLGQADISAINLPSDKNWILESSENLKEWTVISQKVDDVKYTDSRHSAEILLEQHTAKHGGFGIRTWSAEKGNLKSFDETKGQYEFLSPAEFAERFGLDYPIKQFYRARLVE